MSTSSEEQEATQLSDESAESESADPLGVEIGFVEGEGTSFEPEEDPQAAGDG